VDRNANALNTGWARIWRTLMVFFALVLFAAGLLLLIGPVHAETIGPDFARPIPDGVRTGR
jgi:hypothetical protein